MWKEGLSETSAGMKILLAALFVCLYFFWGSLFPV
jgi:hypothetical protein